MTRQSLQALLLGLALLVVGFSITGAPAPAAVDAQSSAADDVETLMRSMSNQQKVGQLFMVSLGGTQPSAAQLEFLQTYQPGAVVLFGTNVNGRQPAQVTGYINQLQGIITDVEGVPLIVAIDHEGGRVQRLLDGFTHFPEPSILGATADPSIAAAIGAAQGRELAAVGVNMNLAPVADLHTRADMLNTSRVLNHRTMSQDPQIVGELATGFTTGLAMHDVIGVVKHFPGHSPTETDSHTEIATVALDRPTVEATNLLAFQTAIDGGAPAIMLGHLYYPALETREEYPASMSAEIVGLLRDNMRFEGLIMTDALDMGGVVNLYRTPLAALTAFKAGVDMLTMGPGTSFADQQMAIDLVLSAVESGEISQEHLDASVRRILQLKADYGLLNWQPLPLETTAERIDVARSSATLMQMFEAGITVVRDEQNALPLQPGDNLAIIYPAGKPVIRETCQQYLPDATYQSYSWWPYDWEFGATQAAVRNADVAIVIAENIGWNTPQGALVEQLPTDNMIYVSLWKPYEWEDIQEIDPNTPGFVVTYSTWDEAQIALCRVLSGQVPARGQLPMAIDGYPVGHGIMYAASGVAVPE
jgi:beta-N-acetylhexosaminidase